MITIVVCFVRSSGFDPNGFKNVLLVTDGLSNIGKDLTLFKAFNLKNDGVEIFVVAVGGFTFGIQEILGLASSSDRHLFRVRDFDGLIEVTSFIPRWSPRWSLPAPYLAELGMRIFFICVSFNLHPRWSGCALTITPSDVNMNHTVVWQVRFVWSPASKLPELAKSHVLHIRDALHFQGTGPISRASPKNEETAKGPIFLFSPSVH